MFAVVTVRFNNETLEANYTYRMKHGYKCIYCSPLELSSKIPYDKPVFVIEMNNSTNKIEGIGLIKNKPETNKYYKVHTDGNNNRFIYIGDYFITRETINNIDPLLVYILDDILFKGKTHSKRGQGLSLIPEKILKFDICQRMDLKKNIRNVFVNSFREKNDKDNNFIDCENVKTIELI